MIKIRKLKAVWEEHTFDQKLKEVNGVSTLKDKATCTTNAIYYKKLCLWSSKYYRNI